MSSTGTRRHWLASTLPAAVLCGCGLIDSSRFFRQKTSWQKTLESMDGIPFRGPVLTSADPIPMVEARRIPPKDRTRFTKVRGFYSFEVPGDRETIPAVSDEQQLAVSLKWLDDEFGLPGNCEFHRGLIADHNGVSPNNVSLRGYLAGIGVEPSRALIDFHGDQVIRAHVWLTSVLPVPGSEQPVIPVKKALESTRQYLEDQGEKKQAVSERLISERGCELVYSHSPTAFNKEGQAELLIPIWRCDLQSSVQVNAYTGVAYTPPEPTRV